MLRRIALPAALLLLVTQASHPLGADEGMWLPSAIGKELPMAVLKSMGCELEASDFWSGDGSGLDGAALQVVQFNPGGAPPFGFGSASFVSSKGLIVTNHHVAFDAIAALSTPNENFVREGFYARSLESERSIKGQGVRLTTVFDDVTSEVLEGVTDAMSDRERAQVIAANIAEITTGAESDGHKDVEVKEMLGGRTWYLTAYDTFNDIRLVYAPPQSIGEYGGDTDNWMWPRHTGDYSFMRAYVAPDGSRAAYSEDNVPFEPKRWLKTSIAGWKPNDFVFILGYPGTTYRYRSSWSLDYRQREYYPANIQALRNAMDRLEEEGRNDEARRLELASEIKSLANTLKNFQGMMDGIHSTGLIARKQREEAAFQAWVDVNPERQAKWGSLLSELDSAYQAPNRQAIITRVVNSSQPILAPYALAAQGIGSGQPVAAVQNALSDLDLKTQRQALQDAILANLALPAAHRLPALSGFDAANLEERVAALIPERITAERIQAIASSEPSTLAKGSPLDRLGMALMDDVSATTQSSRNFNFMIGDIRRRLGTAMAAWRDVPEYPDANSTLRFTFGKVTGYSPRDAVSYLHYTRPEGVVEKHTGKEPFDAPDNLLAAVAAKDWGEWADAELGCVPVNFLSNNDITGGNSGSPIMNARGEIIGLAFDGNYEAMTSDYQFMSEITRTINVDIRYVLWCMDKLHGMQRLIREMDIVR